MASKRRTYTERELRERGYVSPAEARAFFRDAAKDVRNHHGWVKIKIEQSYLPAPVPSEEDEHGE